MNTPITISTSAPSAYTKALSKVIFKVFFSFLLVASFLASCTTEDPDSITNNNGDTSNTPRLENCPDMIVRATTNTFVEWTIPTIVNSSDSVTIEASVLSQNANAARVTATNGIFRTGGTYSILLTAMDGTSPIMLDGFPLTCTFDVIVSFPVFTVFCPQNPVPLNLTISGTSITLSEDAMITVTTLNASGDVAFTYDPANITLDNVGRSVTVTVTAADSAILPNISTCTFTVDVTQNMGSIIYTDTTIICNPTTINATLAADGTPINLAELLANDPGITASNAGTLITDEVTFVYAPATISEAGTYPVFVTALDGDNAVATSDGTNEEICMFDFMVIAAEDPSFSSCPRSASGVVRTSITWSAPILANAPTGAVISPAMITPEGGIITSMEELAHAGTFQSPITYTVTYVARNKGVAIIVNEDELTCTFAVTVTDTAFPGDSAFLLDDNEALPSYTNPFLIQNTNDLSNFARVVNDNVIYNNINTDSAPYRTAAYRLENDLTLVGENNFAPIGNSETHAFMGDFDGNDHTISNLHYSGSPVALGLFGFIAAGASISNLSLSSPMITNHNPATTGISTGALVGTVLDPDSSISKVAILGGTLDAAGITTGGLVGSHSGKIINSAATISVTANGSVGGLVGLLHATGEILASFASGSVSGIGSIGGLVGAVNSPGAANNNGKVYNSYAAGSVISQGGTDVNLGGLVGDGIGIVIINSYARGAVICTDNNCDTRRGLKGGNFTSGIRRSYWEVEGTGVLADNSLDSSSFGSDLMTSEFLPSAPIDHFLNWNDNPLTGTISGTAFSVAGGQWSFTANMYPGLAGNSVPLPQQPLTPATQ